MIVAAPVRVQHLLPILPPVVAKTCPTCGGQRIILQTCSICYGSGSYNGRTCVACGGKKTVPITCPNCQGAGTV